MKNEKETTGADSTQGSGKKFKTGTRTTAATRNAGANMNPEAEGLTGWASDPEASTSPGRSITDRITSQFNSLSHRQKLVGATLLAASAVGTAYLTRSMWAKNPVAESDKAGPDKAGWVKADSKKRDLPEAQGKIKAGRQVEDVEKITKRPSMATEMTM